MRRDSISRLFCLTVLMMNENDKKKTLPELPRLDPRLSSAVKFVRQGGVVCDVGTDHAYLPIYAVLAGISKRGIASDINEGPLMRAKENGDRYGVSDRLSYYLSDGLDGVEPEKNGITDIVICGMGGELIARIVDDSPYTRTKGVRLILQPMSMAYELRKYLTENGFSIVDEAMSHAAGKVYACICAEYMGKAENEPYTETELLFGRHNIAKGGALFRELAEKEAQKLKKRIGGLKSGGHSASAEEALLSEITELVKQHG